MGNVLWCFIAIVFGTICIGCYKFIAGFLMETFDLSENFARGSIILTFIALSAMSKGLFSK